MKYIICIFALWIGWFGHQPTRGKSVAPSIISMTDIIKKTDAMKESKFLGRGKGSVHKKARRLVYGVGINDAEFSTGHNKEREPSYVLWKSILNRCYGSISKKCLYYAHCSVCEEWKTYSLFKKFYDQNYVEGYHIDKDILKRGNKVYSPETCCFVPPEINTLIVKHDATRGEYPIGVSKYKKYNLFRAILRVRGEYKQIGSFKTPELAFEEYKQAKEAHIQEMATQYFNEGKITEKVYSALMNYKVEITD